ncbi:MAG: hydroxyacid dehydrogenase [Deltaproteobacteria bacterium]|nr:hydroxyacid dehydrogenase [Deltaproteobacteria bacterium]MBW1955345.1 hydroxyacid dehydrogenase [Deltaproteobacteria bacterium]MBW2042001.1 hydroxyacid dehydrogenase [Deltaproteobacteria bacterium]
MPDIVISEFMDQEAVDRTAVDYDVYYDPELVEKEAELKRLLSDARALVVRNRTQVDADLLDAAPRLCVVGRLGVGLDNIDTAECEKRGITVCPATGANDDSVAEWVITAVMTLLRGAFLSMGEILEGRWPRSRCIGRETAGKILGLIGYGAIARKTAVRAKALGMEVAAYDPFIPADDAAWEQVTRMAGFGELLAVADAVSLHVPLTRETRHLMDGRAMAQMKKGAVLVNASRGGVVDEEALAKALSSGRLAGAALDVYETEPLTKAAGEIFVGVNNLLLTPHIAGVTVESNIRVSNVTMENVRRVLEASQP